MKTIRFLLDFFPDGRCNLLLCTRKNHRNVWIEKDGTITICFTEDDVKTLKELPRVYNDFNNLNKEYLFVKEKERYKQDVPEP